MLHGVQDVKHTHEGRLHVDKAMGIYHSGLCARRTTTGRAAIGAPALD